MVKTAETQIPPSSLQCLFKLSLLCVAVFAPLIFICFLFLGLSPFLVSISIVFVSTIFIVIFSKKKVVTVENPIQDEGFMCSSARHLLVKDIEEKVIPEQGAVTLCNASQQSEVSDMHDYQVESSDFPSASESGDDFSEGEQNFELSWMSFNSVGKRVAITEISVSSDSDENDEDEDEDDNLIEISFPDTNSVAESEEKLQTDFSEYVPDSFFKQEGIMELLADINEVNEEENLIEIDLSMGFIKGSG